MCSWVWSCWRCLTHLFLTCPSLASIWPLVWVWIGFDGVDTQVISDHFTQFTYYTGRMKARRSFLQIIWLLCIWVLCNERNSRLFKNQECPSFQLQDKVKSYSLWWLKAKFFTFLWHLVVLVEPPNVFEHLLALLLLLWRTVCTFDSLFGTSCAEKIV